VGGRLPGIDILEERGGITSGGLKGHFLEKDRAERTWREPLWKYEGYFGGGAATWGSGREG